MSSPVTDELPPLPVDLRLTPEQVALMKKIRWQWCINYNRIRGAPWNPATDTHLARCEEVIAIIDRALDANVARTH
jgi:hypothetical protein